MAIDMLGVQSSLISAIGHDPDSRTLRIEFKDGSVWDYAEVDAEKFNQLRDAESAGRFFHAEIKKQHTATNVPKAQPDDTQ